VRIAKDVCAIPATSVPCERLFSNGAEIATDRRNQLGAEQFEQLQVLKHAWHHEIIDQAMLNSTFVEEISLERFKDCLVWDAKQYDLEGEQSTSTLSMT
jgi:hAT family C-terminal dimerisation region